MSRKKCDITATSEATWCLRKDDHYTWQGRLECLRPRRLRSHSWAPGVVSVRPSSFGGVKRKKETTARFGGDEQEEEEEEESALGAAQERELLERVLAKEEQDRR